MATRIEIIKAEQAKLDLKMAKEHLRIEADNLILAVKEFKKNPTDKRFLTMSESMTAIKERMDEVKRLTGDTLV